MPPPSYATAAIKEQGDIERREDLNTIEALKSTIIFKDSPEEKECDSAKVLCEVCHNNCQPENLSFQSGVFAEVGSSSSNNNNNNCQPENSNFQSGYLSPRNGEECATVHMLQAARLPER